MRSSLLLRYPLTQRGAMGIDRAPAWLWLGLQTAALWPTWRWLAARVADSADCAPGLLALAALGALLWQVRGQLRCAPRLPWLAAALAGTLVATLLRGPVTPLLTSLLAMLGWACGLLAFLPAERRGAMRVHAGVLWPAPRHAIAAAPVLGLAALALPLIDWPQHAAGYPLCVLTAEVSRWLLAAGFAVQREGANLLVNGQLMVVGAPCAGVQMAWAGCWAACAAALLKGRTDRAFLARLPLVGLALLAGTVLHNSALVALQASGQGASAWVQQAAGWIALAAVCGGSVAVMAGPSAALSNPGVQK